jgi:hypothetical protein
MLLQVRTSVIAAVLIHHVADQRVFDESKLTVTCNGMPLLPRCKYLLLEDAIVCLRTQPTLHLAHFLSDFACLCQWGPMGPAARRDDRHPRPPLTTGNSADKRLNMSAFCLVSSLSIERETVRRAH